MLCVLDKALIMSHNVSNIQKTEKWVPCWILEREQSENSDRSYRGREFYMKEQKKIILQDLGMTKERPSADVYVR